MIKDTPNYWGKPLEDWHKQNLEPLTQELSKLVAERCSVPDCGKAATWDVYCDLHLAEIDKAHEEWLEWKQDTLFIPYEQLSE